MLRLQEIDDTVLLTLISTRSFRSVNAGRQGGDQGEYGAEEPHVDLPQEKMDGTRQPE